MASLVLLIGCASDQASRIYITEKLPPKEANQVEILRVSPTRPYEVIADFQSRGESPQDMQRRAAAIGADAVIVVIAGGYRARSDEAAGQDTQGDAYSRIMGTAIRYK